MKMSRPLSKRVGSDDRLGFVQPPVIFWVTSESFSQQGLQDLGGAVRASSHGAGNDAAQQCYHHHHCDNSHSYDLRQCEGTSCRGKEEGGSLMVTQFSQCVLACVLLTWPLDLIWVSKAFWGRHKHISIGDRRPKRNHVEPAVVSNWSVLLRVNNFTCSRGNNCCYPRIRHSKWILLPCLHVYQFMCTWLVPAEPLIKYCIGEGVQQDKYGIIGWQVSLSTCPIEKEVGQIVEAADDGVIHPLGGTVA